MGDGDERGTSERPSPPSNAVGRHLLGPHVVGQRVVVRHLLPDGRANDVLGVCTSWGARTVVIRSDRGPVEIPVADVVTGKPVPPRPSVRHRVSAHDVELHVASLWPTLRSEPLGTWVLRSAPPLGGRLRRRANSALAMDDPGLPLAEAADRVRSYYVALGQDPLIQVAADGALEAALAPLGFSPLNSGDAHCQLAPVSKAQRAAGPAAGEGRLTEDGRRCRVEYGDSTVVARGEAALDGDWLGLHAILVDESHRRQGLGTRVVADLLDWGASLGATTAWLHVETGNDAGLAAYERLGFVTHHTNRYLVG
ncbi:MAG: Histone acetyltransferase HPA2 and related acetyltransferases [uncultured Nocardioides sp.]|uniref:Histone acetyltransferase HPA2 and related acetyltransferases n=1 Tax=uncultured Nocardioides sp. TaxID=198441 RepID=A0A6J4NGK2_9ACTN|nr:MAG: Histone acetyltransferase HPA2 and related acetyltransferases [uncultured Nocardioides sp.]